MGGPGQTNGAPTPEKALSREGGGVGEGGGNGKGQQNKDR